MLVNNIDPVLFHLGMFEIRYYGIIYALGFLIAYLFLKHYIKEEKLNMRVKQLDDYLFYLLLGVVLGSRLFYFIFYSPGSFSDPLSFFRLWEGGLAFHGGLVGAFLATYLFAKKNTISMMGLVDALAVPSALALALGRIANYTNQELVGTVTNLPWCVQFTAVDSFCRHPYQIYAFLTHILLFGILLFVYKKYPKTGVTFWSFVLGYGVLRILTDFVKVEQKYFGMGMGQLLSIVMVAVAIIALKKSSRSQQSDHS